MKNWGCSALENEYVVHLYFHYFRILLLFVLYKPCRPFLRRYYLARDEQSNYILI